ncbi:inovirus-type Gp2 protein [Rhodoferax sp. GW822-FHT02A01]|uniref:YagK/YfjJ domain-containing protein n=1 Tax=Rhodoferax sp. GW822-FHT02A01 TaxID=3141537 RepID=UPI00315D9610
MSIPETKYILTAEDGRRVLLGNQLEGIRCCLSFMRLTLYGDDLCFKTQTGSKPKRFPQLSPLGEHAQSLRNYAKVFSRCYVFHPLIKFFFEEYRSHLISQVDPGHKPSDCLDSGQVVSDIFDDFVLQMRKDALEIGLKKKVNDWDSKTKKNRIRLKKFETKLFARCGRVCAIRLDLHLKDDMFAPSAIDQFILQAGEDRAQDWEWYTTGRDIDNPEPLQGAVPFEDIQRARERLFTNRKGKTSLFKDLVGYVWRIECAPKAGYHLHAALFFKGSEVESDVYLANEIGKYWNVAITNGQGYFQNVNKAWDKNSPHYGIGMVEHYDSVKRANLRDKVLAYFAKDTQVVQVLPYPGCKLFGSGFAYRDRSKGRGRPRTRGVFSSNQPQQPVL